MAMAGDTVLVSGTSSPRVIEQSEITVRFYLVSCEERGKFVGTAHTHPAATPCGPGRIDPHLAVQMPDKLHRALRGGARGARGHRREGSYLRRHVRPFR